MALVPSCPCCGGLMTGNIRTTLTSACRCGFPAKVTWDDFPALREEQLTEPVQGDPLKRRDA